MYSKVTSITEHDRIAILAFRVITYSTSRILRGHGIVGLGDVLGLDFGEMDDATSPRIRDTRRTKSKYSFSKRSMMISNVSYVTRLIWSFFRSMLIASSHSWSARQLHMSEQAPRDKRHRSNLARPYHTRPEWLDPSPKALLDINKRQTHHKATPTYIPNVMVRSLKLGKVIVSSEASTTDPTKQASKNAHPYDLACWSCTPASCAESSS